MTATQRVVNCAGTRWGRGGDGHKAITAGRERRQLKYCGVEMGIILLLRGGGVDKSASRVTL